MVITRVIGELDPSGHTYGYTLAAAGDATEAQIEELAGQLRVEVALRVDQAFEDGRR